MLGFCSHTKRREESRRGWEKRGVRRRRAMYGEGERRKRTKVPHAFTSAVRFVLFLSLKKMLLAVFLTNQECSYV